MVLPVGSDGEIAAHNADMNATVPLLREMKLKLMDPSLLIPSILDAAAEADHDVAQISGAIGAASYLHRNQTRANRGDLPRTAYIEHPLRGALRAYRYGVRDSDIIIGVILHDTVEDNPFELSAHYAGIQADTEARARDGAFQYIRAQYGPDVESLVRGMTNDIAVPGRTRAEKHADYLNHVVAAIEDPRVAVAKFIDWVDNAAGLHHNIAGAREGMIVRLATKYTPLVPIFIERLNRRDVRNLTSNSGHQAMLTQVTAGGARLAQLLQHDVKDDVPTIVNLMK